MSHLHGDTLPLGKKTTPNKAPPFPPSSVLSARLCLPFDILSEGLYIQTALQLLWLINSTGFENDLKEENGNAVLNPFSQSATLLPRKERGKTSKAPPGAASLSCLSSHSQWYVHSCKGG